MNGLLEAPHVPKTVATVVVKYGAAWIECECLGEILKGFLVTSELVVAKSAAVITRHGAWLKSDSTVKVSDGPGSVFHLVVSAAAVVIRVGIFWLDAQCSCVVLHRFLVAAQLVV